MPQAVELRLSALHAVRQPGSYLDYSSAESEVERSLSSSASILFSVTKARLFERVAPFLKALLTRSCSG